MSGKRIKFNKNKLVFVCVCVCGMRDGFKINSRGVKTSHKLRRKETKLLTGVFGTVEIKAFFCPKPKMSHALKRLQ